MHPFADPRAALGTLSALLSALAYLPYLRDVITGRTQPQRASWLIWSVLGCIALASLVHEGATASLAFAAVQVGGTVLVFVLSIALGRGRYLRPADYGVLLAAVAGLALWHLTEDASYALAITIGVSLLGGTVTVAKAYSDPGSETASTWAVFLLASALAVLSVRGWDPVLLAYPLYLVALYAAIVAAMILGRARAPQPIP